MRALAHVLCKKLHAIEWAAPYPRTYPCKGCFDLANTIHNAGWRKP